MLILHFGMTGSLSWQASDRPRHRHDRLVWSLTEGELRYRDMRELQGVRLAGSRAQADRMLGEADRRTLYRVKRRVLHDQSRASAAARFMAHWSP